MNTKPRGNGGRPNGEAVFMNTEESHMFARRRGMVTMRNGVRTGPAVIGSSARPASTTSLSESRSSVKNQLPAVLRNPETERNEPTLFRGGEAYTKIFLKDQQRSTERYERGAGRPAHKTDLRITCQDGHFFVHRAVIPSHFTIFRLLEAPELSKEEVTEIILSEFNVNTAKAVFSAFYSGWIPLLHEDEVPIMRDIKELCDLLGIKNLERSQLSQEEINCGQLTSFTIRDIDASDLISDSDSTNSTEQAENIGITPPARNDTPTSSSSSATARHTNTYNLPRSRLSPGDNAAKDDEDFSPSTSSQPARSSQRSEPSRSNPATPGQRSPPINAMPTTDEVCDLFGVQDIHINFTDSDYANLTTYKLYDKQIRPILQKKNPKAPYNKLSMLVAAKWREFCTGNPNVQDSEDKSKQAAKPTTPREDVVEDDEEDDYDEDSMSSSKHPGSRTSTRKNRGRKSSADPQPGSSVAAWQSGSQQTPKVSRKKPPDFNGPRSKRPRLESWSSSQSQQDEHDDSHSSSANDNPSTTPVAAKKKRWTSNESSKSSTHEFCPMSTTATQTDDTVEHMESDINTPTPTINEQTISENRTVAPPEPHSSTSTLGSSTRTPTLDKRLEVPSVIKVVKQQRPTAVTRKSVRSRPLPSSQILRKPSTSFAIGKSNANRNQSVTKETQPSNNLTSRSTAVTSTISSAPETVGTSVVPPNSSRIQSQGEPPRVKTRAVVPDNSRTESSEECLPIDVNRPKQTGTATGGMRSLMSDLIQNPEDTSGNACPTTGDENVSSGTSNVFNPDDLTEAAPSEMEDVEMEEDLSLSKLSDTEAITATTTVPEVVTDLPDTNVDDSAIDESTLRGTETNEGEAPVLPLLTSESVSPSVPNSDLQDTGPDEGEISEDEGNGYDEVSAIEGYMTELVNDMNPIPCPTDGITTTSNGGEQNLISTPDVESTTDAGLNLGAEVDVGNSVPEVMNNPETSTTIAMDTEIADDSENTSVQNGTTRDDSNMNTREGSSGAASDVGEEEIETLNLMDDLDMTSTSEPTPSAVNEVEEGEIETGEGDDEGDGIADEKSDDEDLEIIEHVPSEDESEIECIDIPSSDDEGEQEQDRPAVPAEQNDYTKIDTANETEVGGHSSVLDTTNTSTPATIDGCDDDERDEEELAPAGSPRPPSPTPSSTGTITLSDSDSESVASTRLDEDTEDEAENPAPAPVLAQVAQEPNRVSDVPDDPVDSVQQGTANQNHNEQSNEAEKTYSATSHSSLEDDYESISSGSENFSDLEEEFNRLEGDGEPNVQQTEPVNVNDEAEIDSNEGQMPGDAEPLDTNAVGHGNEAEADDPAAHHGQAVADERAAHDQAVADEPSAHDDRYDPYDPFEEEEELEEQGRVYVNGDIHINGHDEIHGNGIALMNGHNHLNGDMNDEDDLEEANPEAADAIEDALDYEEESDSYENDVFEDDGDAQIANGHVHMDEQLPIPNGHVHMDEQLPIPNGHVSEDEDVNMNEEMEIDDAHAPVGNGPYMNGVAHDDEDLSDHYEGAEGEAQDEEREAQSAQDSENDAGNEQVPGNREVDAVNVERTNQNGEFLEIPLPMAQIAIGVHNNGNRNVETEEKTFCVNCLMFFGPTTYARHLCF